MIADASFNFQSLSSTIMFAFKRLMIVDKITLQDRVAVKKSLARAEVCNFDGIWNFSQEVVS